MQEYDIAIVGAGPAGATFARLIDKKYRVLLLDPKTEEAESFTKVCGGLLSGDAQKALSRYALTLPKDLLVDPQIFAVKTLDIAAGLVRSYPRFYINLDRQKFDLWLASLVPPWVEKRTDRIRSLKKEGESFFLQGEKGEYQARYLVGPMEPIPWYAAAFSQKRKYASMWRFSNGFRRPILILFIPVSSILPPAIAAPGLFPRIISLSTAAPLPPDAAGPCLNSRRPLWPLLVSVSLSR